MKILKLRGIKAAELFVFMSALDAETGKKIRRAINFGGFLAETARFELAGDRSLTDFESAPL